MLKNNLKHASGKPEVFCIRVTCNHAKSHFQIMESLVSYFGRELNEILDQSECHEHPDQCQCRDCLRWKNNQRLTYLKDHPRQCQCTLCRANIKSHPDGCQCNCCVIYYGWPRSDKLNQHPAFCQCQRCVAWRGSRQGG